MNNIHSVVTNYLFYPFWFVWSARMFSLVPFFKQNVLLFTRVTAEPEILGAWFAKVFLDGISQQTNVEATWSESKETKLSENSAPPKKGNSNKTTRVQKPLCLCVCVLSDIC